MKLPLLSLVALVCLFSSSIAQESRFEECLNSGRKGLIMDGFDPVSYFREGGDKPKKGKKNLQVVYRKGIYRFASQRNHYLFLSHPSRFAPAYGGWCAYAMAKNKLVGINPKSYLFVDGSLMLYFDGFFDDTRAHWIKEGANLKLPQADKVWLRRSNESRIRSVAMYHLNGDLALGGYDPVSYHKAGGPLEGKQSLSTKDRGITYLFSNAENRIAFIADPDSYEPAFGGWCALAMASGKRVASDHTEFTIQNGRLFVFAKGELSQVEIWKMDAVRQRATALKAWRGMQQKTP